MAVLAADGAGEVARAVAKAPRVTLGVIAALLPLGGAISPLRKFSENFTHYPTRPPGRLVRTLDGSGPNSQANALALRHGTLDGHQH